MNNVMLPYGFTPRAYQLPVYKYMRETKKRQRAMLIFHRRAGKDLTAWNILIEQAYTRVGTYWHMLPQLNQGRRVIWDGRDKSGRTFLSYIPNEIIQSVNKAEMKILLKNGSIIQIVGADNIDTLVGTNPVGVVFSEFALMSPKVWQFISPILNENDGWAMFVTTPRGKNHAYDLLKGMVKSKKGFVQILTVNDTLRPVLDSKGLPILDINNNIVLEPVVSDESIQTERDHNVPEEIIQQEYYCSFNAGLVGSYYGQQLERVLKENRIVQNLYNSKLPVYTAWDLGISDAMSIWFFQYDNSTKVTHIIDYVEFTNTAAIAVGYIIQGEYDKLEESKLISDTLLEEIKRKYSRFKTYNYKDHFAPHDIKTRELTTGKSRLSVMSEHGIKFKRIKRTRVSEGIDNVRKFLINCFFDEKNCDYGINALKAYTKKYNEKTNSFSDEPLHDWSSHAADSFRYLVQAIGTYIDTRYNNDITKQRSDTFDPLSIYNSFNTRFNLKTNEYNPLHNI